MLFCHNAARSYYTERCYHMKKPIQLRYIINSSILSDTVLNTLKHIKKKRSTRHVTLKQLTWYHDDISCRNGSKSCLLEMQNIYLLKKCHYIHTLFSPTINWTHLPVIWLWITMFLWPNTTNKTPTILSLIYIYTYSNINAKLKANCNSTWHLLMENSHRTSWRNTTLLHTLVHCCWRHLQTTNRRFTH